MSHEETERDVSGKESLVRALRNSPEDLAPLREFLSVREAACKNGMDNLRLTLDFLDIYIGGGEAFLEAALQTLEAGFEQAEGEQSVELVREFRLREEALRGRRP